MEYLISINNQESGPYSLGQLQSMIQNGQVNLDYWVCRKGSDTWTKINLTPELSEFFNVQVLPQPVQAQTPFDSNKKLRHGFTSFWLWLCIIFYIIGILVLLVDFLMDGELIAYQYPNITDFDIWVIRIVAVLYVYALKNLLNWKKSGFWLTVAVTAITIVLDPFNSGLSIYTIIGMALPVGILYGVLQFKNAYNAKSAWEQLE